MSSSTSTTFDLDGYVAAIESGDPAREVAAYAPDAVVETFNRDHGPGAPVVVRGREALRAHADEVASRNLRHEVRRAALGDRTGFVEVGCAYPDGTQVLCVSTFDHERGAITKETRLEVWDA